MPHILGIGTDIEEISRFHKHIIPDASVSDLIRDIFTPEEITRNLSSENPYLCLALGFSCKESVFKALGRSWMNAPITWKEIECVFHGKPENKGYEIRLSGGALNLFQELGGKRIESELEIKNDHVVFRVILWK